MALEYNKTDIISLNYLYLYYKYINHYPNMIIQYCLIAIENNYVRSMKNLIGEFSNDEFKLYKILKKMKKNKLILEQVEQLEKSNLVIYYNNLIHFV